MIGLSDFKVGVGSEEENRVHLAALTRFARESLRVRMHGSAALDLAWLAAGRLHATVMLSNLPWDVTAGLLLVREAGGVVFDYDGSSHDADSRFTLASAPSLVEAVRGDRGGGDVRRGPWHRRPAGAHAASAPQPQTRERIAVFAPSPLLTVTIEPGSDRPEVHLHAGGQGFWVAHLAATLGADVVLCCALGGEPGAGAARADRGRAGDAASGRRADPERGVRARPSQRRTRRGRERREQAAGPSRVGSSCTGSRSPPGWTPT